MYISKTYLFAIIILISVITGCSKNTDKSETPVPPHDTTIQVLNDLVYAGTTQGSVCAYNAVDGTIKWSTNLFAGSLNLGFNSTPTLANGVVYIGCPPNKVVALDAVTGAIKWTCVIESYSDYFFCSPLVVNGRLYIGHNNTFYAINATDGTIVWKYSVPPAYIANQFDESSPCYANGVVYVNCVDDPAEGLYGFNAVTGEKVLQYRYSFDNATIVSPAAYNNCIYTAFDDNGSSVIFRYNLDNPGLSELYHVLSSGSSSPSIFDSTIYVGSSNYLYSYADSTPENIYKWRFEAASSLSSSYPTADSNKVYIGSGNGILYAVNDSNGVKAWEYQTLNNGSNIGPSTSPVLANGVVYYAAISGLYAVNAATGKLIWNNNEGGGIYSSPCVIDKNGQVYHSSISGIKN